MAMDPTTLLLLLALLFGLYMAWGIGANDVANAMATSVGARAITVKQAILIAAVFEFLGAFLAGGEVTSTIRKGIIDSSALVGDPDVLILGMLAALLAAAVWLTVASRFGWPVSTTHSIVGAIVGFAIATIGMEAVHFDKVGSIAASWVVSPLLAGTLSFLLVRSVQWLILDRPNPELYARRYVPAYIFLAALNISLVTLLKGLKHIGLDLTAFEAIGYSVAFALVIMAGGAVMVRRIHTATATEMEDYHYANVERTFAVLMIVTACAMAFAHGSNDVANAIGPVAAIISTVQSGEVFQKASVPPYVLLLGAAGIVIGLATYGYRVMATVGRKITELTPSRGFAAELAAASTVVLASGTGLPISTTHTLVGAVLGVGLARGISALNLGVIRTIFMSWVITLPVGAVLAVLFYYMLRAALL
jgi:PiT family inorganic phosphate transporter